jgi:hypothetical protein
MDNFTFVLTQLLGFPLMIILTSILILIPLTMGRIAWKVFKWAWSR